MLPTLKRAIQTTGATENGGPEPARLPGSLPTRGIPARNDVAITVNQRSDTELPSTDNDLGAALIMERASQIIAAHKAATNNKNGWLLTTIMKMDTRLFPVEIPTP